MATIDNNNLPKGVTYNENSGLYVITNSKGQTSRVNADSAAQLNTYNTSWQTGKPATVSVVDPNTGNTKTKEYNPSNIIGQQQATTEYQANLTALKRADVLPNKDGTYSSRTTGAVLTEAELQQKVAAAGLPPNTLEIQKNGGKFNPTPSPASVEASTAAVNDVTNIPSNVPPAPAPPETGAVNSPLTVDPAIGATIVKEEPKPEVQPVSTVPITQRQAENADPEGTANIQEQNATAQKQTQDADPEGTANIQEQNARPQKQTQDADPEGTANVEEQYAKPQKQTQDADPEGTANIQEQNARPQKQVEDNDPEGNANIQLQEQNAAANEEAIRNAGELGINSNSGLTGAKQQTQEQAVLQDVVNFQAKADWRVRLSLSPGAQQAGYLYWAQSPGILAPLRATDGVIFPYTPSISVAYNATYDATELTHSNYNFYTYKNSKVESITLGCDFTAQDTFEANYLLAVIHFFRTATKMFYGQDQNPKNGTPPPLCYLSGLGAFQFDAHPLAITGFNYSLPTDVDYIRAGNNPSPAGVNRENSPTQPKGTAGFSAAGLARMFASNINPGGLPREVKFNSRSSYTSTIEPTYVPTKISLSISAVPIVTRNDISNKFSLKQYATGSLLRGTKRAGGGIW